MHLDAKIPHNFYGSPIFNEKGKVVGIYGRAASPADQDSSQVDSAMKDIHYVSLVAPEIIRQWTEKRDEKLWVSPAAESTFTTADQSV